MDLYLVRHAIAEPRKEDLPDAQRQLTKKGLKRFAQCVDGLKALNVSLDQVLHSPWARAQQTAELLKQISTGSCDATPSLADAPSVQLLESITGKSVALVGHEPWMSEMLSWLTTGDLNGLNVVFKKGGVAWLQGNPAPNQMVLKAMLPPKVLCSMGS